MKNDSNSPKGKILLHLQSGRPITGLIALRTYGVYRLSSCINRLRNEGHNIVTDMKRDLFGKQFAEYRLVK